MSECSFELRIPDDPSSSVWTVDAESVGVDVRADGDAAVAKALRRASPLPRP